jgi:translation initiation factor 1 (eIF-1/SUI1)
MKITTILLVTLTLTLAACSAGDKSSDTKQNDQGTGINTVSRQYAKSALETWDAATAAVKSYELKLESDRHDTMGGEIQAHRANGDKVIVRVQSLDDQNSDVSVRVEPGNRNLAEMIQEKIADKLGLRVARSAFFGGNSCEGRYPISLDACVQAAEDASQRLNLTVTNRDVRDGAAIVDARESNSNPVQFKMKRMGEGTKVTFIAGREKTDATRDFASRMKAEFENSCTAKGD